VRLFVAVIGLLLATPVALTAATSSVTQGSQPIYSAFSLIKSGKITTRRCGAYDVTTGTYTGRAASGDPRLAGAVTYTSRIALSRETDTGVATGTLTVRDPRSRVRMRARITGVMTQRSVVNGILAGNLMLPSALILANLTMVFDDELGFAAVRLGVESGSNSAVAYPPLPKC
jgi:hypothetical protein